jgi:hypothetical protein
METPAAIEAYDRFCDNVYRHKHVSSTVARYDEMRFEDAFRAIAKDAGFNADDPMEEENPKCKTCVQLGDDLCLVLSGYRVVFAVDAKNMTVLQVIRSYKVRSNPNPPFTILQAARATMASPDLFPSVYVGSIPDDKEYVAWFTNPIKSILEEGGKAFCDTNKVACILSLGAGTKLVEGLHDHPQPDDRLKMLASVAEDCEAAHRDAASLYGHSGIYHCINVERDLLHTTREEWDEDFTHISQATRNHLEANLKTLDRVVDCFVHRTGGPTIRDLSSLISLCSISTALISQ